MRIPILRLLIANRIKKAVRYLGELEPYGKVWRTGANEATEITLTDRIKFGGKALDA